MEAPKVWGAGHRKFYNFWVSKCPSDEHTIEVQFLKVENSVLLILVGPSELWAWGCSPVRFMVKTALDWRLMYNNGNKMS